jgi:hypothetical protein
VPADVYVAKVVVDAITAVETPSANGARLLGNHPNPFNPATTIILALDAAGPVAVTVHDLRGRRLRHLFGGRLDAGRHAWSWDGRDGAGRELPAGVYLVRAAGAGGAAGCRVALVR